MNSPTNIPPNNITGPMNPGLHLCARLKQLLVEHGHEALAQHADLAAHAATCADCQRLLRAWNALPGLLEQLPEHEPDEAVVERIRETVAGARSGKPGPRRYLAPSLASAAVLLAAVGISHQLLMRESPRAPLPNRPPQVQVEAPQAAGQSTSGPTAAREADRDGGRVDDFAALSKEQSEQRPAVQAIEGEEKYYDSRSEMAEPGAAAANQAGQYRRKSATPPAAQPEEEMAAALDSGDKDGNLVGSTTERPASSRTNQNERSAVDTSGGDRLAAEPEVPPETRPDAGRAGEFALQEAQKRPAPAEAPSTQPPAGAETSEVTATEALRIPEFDFLAHYQVTDGLTFQPATGYWANHYIPGDPEIRLLSARLAQWDRSWVPGDAGLERDVRPIAQPFDAPEDHALALSLLADAAAVAESGAGATRLRVQVGLQGIEHRVGQRPAMNLGVVIDLPAGVPDAVRIAARALLEGLLEAKQAGDQFSLVITGEPGRSAGLIVEPDDFRHGPLQLARDLITGAGGAAQGVAPDGAVPASSAIPQPPVLDTRAALEGASELVRAGEDGTDDSDRPLGSSAVLLIGARELADLDALTALAHANARDGITLSVFPLGNAPANEAVEQLVLAGLGQRRYLEAPADARRLVEDELHAASRAVAHAARLSIRLADGVKLVSVIGSERLDTRRAERVREVENAMDMRLAANLGIAADRGEDEQGIQMVIPTIYAGDTVTVLLDVVAGRPGPIAEVTLRYKDLVFKRNGTLHGRLDLPSADAGATPAPERGPAELSVLKNLLAWHFTEAVESAAEALAQGQPEAALKALTGIYETYEWVRLKEPALNHDQDLIRDQNVLERYLEALRAPEARDHAAELADSLRLAAWAKTHGQPEHPAAQPPENWK